MIDERNRMRMKAALVEPFNPPRPDLERLAFASIERRRVQRPNRALALAAFALFMVLAVSVALAGHLLRPNPGPATPRQQVQILLAQLRDRPMNLPQLGAGGRCIETPQVLKNAILNKGQKQPDTLSLYGTDGPIYGAGGPKTTGEHGYYYDVTWLSDAKYNGAALIRGRKLDGPEQIVFAGPLATGTLVTTDVIGGKSTPFYSELVIPSGQATGGLWRQWHLYQGVPGPGCYGFQVDGPTFQQTVVVDVPQGG